jgi:SAM-dependent methyltransferase
LPLKCSGKRSRTSLAVSTISSPRNGSHKFMKTSTNRSYISFYEEYKFFNGFKFLIDTRKGKSVRRQALLNRYKDYLWLAGHKDFLDLHLQLNKIIEDSSKDWTSYDYGEGYFYTGLAAIGVTGFRDSDARYKMMGISELLKGKRVLEIGCNTGFLTVLMSFDAKNVVAFDINPYLIQIAKTVSTRLRIDNIEYNVAAFEQWPMTQYDVVVSLANHHTYDENTKHSIEEYFQKSFDLLVRDGLFLFESHPHSYEGDGLGKTVDVLQKYFKIERQQESQWGTFWDRHRTFVVARKSSGYATNTLSDGKL